MLTPAAEEQAIKQTREIVTELNLEGQAKDLAKGIIVAALIIADAFQVVSDVGPAVDRLARATENT